MTSRCNGRTKNDEQQLERYEMRGHVCCVPRCADTPIIWGAMSAASYTADGGHVGWYFPFIQHISSLPKYQHSRNQINPVSSNEHEVLNPAHLEHGSASLIHPQPARPRPLHPLTCSPREPSLPVRPVLPSFPSPQTPYLSIDPTN
jgi:hypothetical protein